MKNFGSISFNGKSGSKYQFDAWPLDTQFKALPVVYFVTRRVFQNTTYHRASHEGIYIGQTGDLSGTFSGHVRLDCFGKHGANCVCICVVENDAQRLLVEEDLIASQSPPCN